MRNFRVSFICILIFQAGVQSLHAQPEEIANKNTREGLYNITQQAYGLDDILLCGVKYFPSHARANGTPNFDYIPNEPSKLYIKGRSYSNLDLFYDIELDQLVLKYVLQDGFEHVLILNTNNVDSFSLGKHMFINVGNLNQKDCRNGYYEKINSGDNQYLKKHKKTFIEIYDNLNIGKFSSQNNTNFIFSEGKLKKVDSKKAFLDCYRNIRKDVVLFMRENKINYRKASNNNLAKLMTFCNEKTLQND